MPPPSKRNKGTKRRKKDIEDDGLPANAADVFLAYGGLNYVSASDLRACGVVNRAFKNHARRDFDKRLRECHPSLALAAETNNYNITWKDWRRFELDEVEGTGDRWSVRVSDLGGDIDVLLELKKRDGTVVWHGCTPLRRDPGDTPACVFAVPHTVLDVSKPQEGDAFEEPDTNYPGLMSYHYWCGRGDCSLQQKSICKALHGVNTSSLLQAHVVLRRRSTGQMVTVLSTSKPNQVIGEDYGNEVGEYFVIYNCNSLLYEVIGLVAKLALISIVQKRLMQPKILFDFLHIVEKTNPKMHALVFVLLSVMRIKMKMVKNWSYELCIPGDGDEQTRKGHRINTNGRMEGGEWGEAVRHHKKVKELMLKPQFLIFS